MHILPSGPDSLALFWLVLGRSSGVVATAPLLSSSSLPGQVRAILAVLVAVVALPAAAAGQGPLPSAVLPLVFGVAEQVVVGLLLGLMAQIVFSVAQIAGAALDVQLGFSIAQEVDPLYGQPISLLSNWFNLLASLAYLAAGGLEVLVGAVTLSFQHLSLSAPLPVGATTQALLSAVTWAFGLALTLALPVMAVSLALSLILGLIGRIVPQFNVLQSVLPAQTLVSTAVLLLVTPTLVSSFTQLVPATLARLGGVLP